MITHQLRIEQAARDAITSVNADPFLLNELMDRLHIFHDDKAAQEERTRVLGINGEKPVEVLKNMSQQPEFASRFFQSSSDASERDLEARVTKQIQSEIQAIAPNGDPMRVAPAVKLQIADEIRALHGLGTSHESLEKRERQPQPELTCDHTATFGEYANSLKTSRITASTASSYIEGLDPVPTNLDERL